MIAERVEFLVNSIFSIDDQGLMLGDVVRLAEVFKDRGIGGLKTVSVETALVIEPAMFVTRTV